MPDLRLRVWKDRTIPAHKHPWMITCPVGCKSPADGINSGCGWEDQETASRVAQRHLDQHLKELNQVADLIASKPVKDIFSTVREMMEGLEGWLVRLHEYVKEAEPDTRHVFRASEKATWILCTEIVEVDGTERQCGKLRDDECHKEGS